MEEDYSEHHNPYIAGKALRKDEDFFGREDIIRDVKMTLVNDQNNMIVLYGQRRIGKTSILNKLERALINPPFLVTNFDLLDKARMPINELLFEIAAEIAKKAGLEFDNKEAFLANPDSFHNDFLPTLYEKLGKDKKLVLLFDEFDVLDETEEKLSDTAAANALHKYIHQLNLTQFNIHFVFVVGRRMEDIGSKLRSTFKEAKTIPVFVLKEEDALALIKRGENQNTSFDQDAIAEILFYTRGHPYFIQLLCLELLNRYLPDKKTKRLIITREMVISSIKPALEHGETAFSWIWDGLPSAERIVFSAIAENTRSEQILTDDDITKILQEAGIKRLAQDLDLAPSKLVEWKMLENVGGGYRFYFEFVRIWVEENKKLNKVKEELEKIDPIADAHYQTAFKYYRANKNDDALSQLEVALKNNPNHSKAWALKGRILYNRREYLDAIEDIKRAYKIDEMGVRAQLIQAMLEYGVFLEDKGEDEAAEKVYDDILQNVYEYEETAVERRKRILINRGNDRKFKQEYLQAFQAYKSAGADKEIVELVREILNQVLQFEGSGHWSIAEGLYTLLATMQPDVVEWFEKQREMQSLIQAYEKIELAYPLYQSGNFDDATLLFNDASQLLPQKPLGKSSMDAVQDLKKKIIDYVQAIKGVSKSIREAQDAHDVGEYESALQSIERIKNVEPQSQYAHAMAENIEKAINLIVRSKESYNAGDNLAAKKYLTQALKGEFVNKDVHELLEEIEEIDQLAQKAVKAYKVSDLQNAEEISATILSKQSSNIQIRTLVKKIAGIREKYKKARSYYNGGDLEAAYDLITTVLSDVRNYSDALQLKQKIDDLTDRLERAESAYQSGSLEEAQELIDFVLESQPSNSRAREMQQEIEQNKVQAKIIKTTVIAIVALIFICIAVVVVMAMIGILVWLGSLPTTGSALPQGAILTLLISGGV